MIKRKAKKGLKTTNNLLSEDDARKHDIVMISLLDKI